MPDLRSLAPPGVVTGDDLLKLMTHCHHYQIALPTFNCSSFSTINAILETAQKIKSPVIIQFNNDEAVFMAGLGMDNEGQKAAILGSMSIAQHVHLMAKTYEVQVVLHSDCCSQESLDWFQGMLDVDETNFKAQNLPLFSSHGLDLTKENEEEEIVTKCEEYFQRMASMKIWLEIKLKIDQGVAVEGNFTNESHEKVWNVYQALSQISPMFSIVTTFDERSNANSQGLADYQSFVKTKLSENKEATAFFAIQVDPERHTPSHETSLSTSNVDKNEVVKINFDDEARWAYWNGLRMYYLANQDYLETQVGNPEGEDKPNKKFYDPRVLFRIAELSMIARAQEIMNNLVPPAEAEETDVSEVLTAVSQEAADNIEELVTSERDEITVASSNTLDDEGEDAAVEVLAEVTVAHETATSEEIVESADTEVVQDMSAAATDQQESSEAAIVQITEIPFVIEEEIVVSSEVEEMTAAKPDQITAATAKIEITELSVVNEQETVTVCDTEELAIIIPKAEEQLTVATVNFQVTQLSAANEEDKVITEVGEETAIQLVAVEQLTTADTHMELKEMQVANVEEDNISSVTDGQLTVAAVKVEFGEMPVANGEETMTADGVEEASINLLTENQETVAAVNVQVSEMQVANGEETLANSDVEEAVNPLEEQFTTASAVDEDELASFVHIEMADATAVTEEFVTEDEPPVEPEMATAEVIDEEISLLNAKRADEPSTGSEFLPAVEETVVIEVAESAMKLTAQNDDSIDSVNKRDTSVKIFLPVVEEIVEEIVKINCTDTAVETKQVTAEVQSKAVAEQIEPLNLKEITVEKDAAVGKQTDSDKTTEEEKSRLKDEKVEPEIGHKETSTTSEDKEVADSTDDVKTSIKNAVQSLNCLKKATEPVEAAVTAVNEKTAASAKEVKFHSTSELVVEPISEEVKKVEKAEFVEFESDKVALWCNPVTTLNNGPVLFQCLQALKLFLGTGFNKGFFVRGQTCGGCQRGCLGCGHRRLSRRGLKILERGSDGGPNIRPKIWSWRSKRNESS